ncbi:MAG: protein kinase, partial [Gammaproteobacteria bacterium]|nr:protein kinase [Gammaproteobacteria bacterium]
RNALEPGHQIHWYTLDRVLGQGGFGITYLARDNNLAQRVAIKEYLPLELAVREADHSVHPNTADHDELYGWGLDRFVTEGKTLARFDHPSIVRVLTVFEANNTAYLVMRYEEGNTLAEALKGRKTLDEDRLRGILLPLLDGLELVHAEGFIHRDIKPANIFLRENGSPVLIDFGSARQALGHETRTLTTLVSPGYAPFEQYSNRADEQGPWTDIYSLAATMYRGVAGISPPDALDRSHRMHADEPDPLVAAAEVGGDRYSPAFLDSIDWGLAFRRQDRPQSIALWRDALESGKAMQAHEAATERAPAWAAPEPPTVVQRSGTDTAPETALDSDQKTLVLDDAGPAPPAKGRRRFILFAVLVVGLGAVGALLLRRRSRKAAGARQDTADISETNPSPAPAAESGTPAANDAAPSRPTTPKPDPAADLHALFETARKQEAAGRTLWPAGDNAFETYKAALARDPDNAEAKERLRNLVEKELGSTVEAVKRKDFDSAERTLDRLSELVPNSERLEKFREKVLKAKRKSR